MERLSRIYRDIKEIRIQGASKIARAALEAYYLKPDEENKKKLKELRPTEPMLVNVLNRVNNYSRKEIVSHFDEAQDRINKEVFKIIKNGMKIYTHCHSTNVLKALIYAKKKGKRFEVFNTETRPLFQGRKTAKEIANAGIKMTSFVDSGMHEAVVESDVIMIGADAILNSGAINKIGSGAITEIAFFHKKPIYIIADSWKYSPKNVKIEERDFREVWKRVPRNVKVRNPAFEKIEKKYIKKIISELGNLDYNKFLKRVTS